MRSLTWKQVLGWRLGRHHLLEPAPLDQLVQVAGEVCGVHAQVMTSAELSLGLRVAGATWQVIRHELWERRSLVKTYGIRGTIHLFPAAELPMWLAALRANSRPNEARPPREGELDAEQTDAVVQAIGAALDGRRLARDELGKEIAGRIGRWVLEEAYPAWGGSWPRWWTALGAAAVAGTLCFGPNQGNRVTFARPDQWVGPMRTESGTDALIEVLRRYLAAYGPATADEFAQWFAMRPGAARALFGSLAAELEEVEVEGELRWARSADLSAAWEATKGVVRLLPRFDVYVVGGFPRDRLIPPAIATQAQATGVVSGRGQPARSLLAGPTPVLIVDGAEAGVWEHHRKGKRVELVVQPFVRASARLQRELERESRRVGNILGAEASLTIGKVKTRPHL